MRYVALMLLVAGCATSIEDKRASFRPWESHRTAIEQGRIFLYGGADNVEVEMRDGRAYLQLEFRSRQRKAKRSKSFRFEMPRTSQGLAVPIEPKGYFLTAAHMTDDGPIHLVWSHGGKARSARAETIWRDPEIDLALLRADLGDVPAYPWGPVPEKGAGVFAAACGCPSAGRVVGVDRLGGALAVCHDAPVRDGDSGAAILDANNRLVGVHSATTLSFPWFRKVRRAVRPDLAELKRRTAR